MNLANAQIKQGETGQATLSLRNAIELDPLLVPAYGPLAELELHQGQIDAVLGHLRRAVNCSPVRRYRWWIWALRSRRLGAMAMPWHPWCAAVALDPLLVPASQRLAWLLATSPEPSLSNGPEAVALAEGVGHATGDREAVLLDTLAAACAEAGQYECAPKSPGAGGGA